MYGRPGVFCAPGRYSGGADLAPRRALRGPDHVKASEEAGGNVPTWLVAIEFADANGAWWLRDLQEKLMPV